jgi:DNA-directed RNA polymerase subunit RPC12/RpoP
MLPVNGQDFAQPNADAKGYRCSQCGGEMNYDAGTRSMVCGHCGSATAIPDSEGHRAIVEYDLEHGLAMSRARGYGTEVRTTQCQECGASVSFAGATTATQCDFCGSSQVLEQDENRNVLRPESLVPFQVEREDAQQKFSGWLKGLWFRPSDLKHKARVAEMSGVYVPYWTFDAAVRSDWTAQAGYYYYETESYTEKDANGNLVVKTRQVRRVRWEPAWGSRRDQFDDVLVCASGGLPKDLAGRLQTFDTTALCPYDPSYLSGWKAEEYAVELNDGWKQAVDHMESEQERRCRSDVPGDTQRFLNVVNHFAGETFKHILLPIWISAYRYKDKTYRFLVNGQTGEVTGKAPLSVIKITLFILALLAAIAAVVVLLSNK